MMLRNTDPAQMQGCSLYILSLLAPLCCWICWEDTVQDGRVKYDLEPTEDGWHYFGMDWQPDGYVFYCDGKQVSRCNAHVSHVPQFILLTTEVRGYRRILQMKERGDDLSEAKFAVKGELEDDAFIVDFVRVFDKMD